MANDPWALGLAIFTFGLSSANWTGWEVSSEPIIYEGAGDHNWNHPADAAAGAHSQQVGADGGDFVGGLVQRLNVEAGRSYQITTSMKYRTFRPGSRVTYRVGIDSTGQTTNGRAGSIFWGNELIGTQFRETEVWTASSELFTATGGTVSIWIEATSPSLEPFRISVDEVSVE